MATKKTAEKLPPESTVYIGPSFPGLTQYTVFRGGKLPDHIAAMAVKNGNIAALIIPVSHLQKARENMQIKGHILNLYVNNLKHKE